MYSSMKSPLIYRAASILIGLFAAAHTVGFRQSNPKWGVDGLLASMKSIHFETQGFHRSYWDFFSGFGFFVSIFLVLAALLAWQFGGLSRVELRAWLLMQWALPLCFIGVTVLSWRYFFMAPLL